MIKIRILITLISIFQISALLAQFVPSIEWQKSLGGSSGETSNAILETADGGFLTAGYSWSSDHDVTANHGLSDYWIVKLDAIGNVQWQKAMGGSDNDVAWAMQQTTDGGYIIAGYARSDNGDIPLNHGLTDYCIMKLDADGNLIWEKSLGGSDDDWAYAVQQTTSGGYIVAGYSKSADGDLTINHGGWDYWVVLLNSNGNLTWQKSLGGSSDDEAYAVVQADDGGFVIAGGSDSNDGDAAGNHGEGDEWIVKLDSSGNLIWQRSLGGSGDEYAYAITKSYDGGYAVAGSTASVDGDIVFNHGHADYSILKLNADGMVQWEKSLGGSQYDIPNDIQQTSDGGYVIAGFSNSTDGDVSGNHGQNDYWIVKIDSIGNMMWGKAMGGSDNDQANALRQNVDGSYIIAGLSFSNDGDVSGNHANNNGTTEDYWIVKLSAEETSAVPLSPLNFISVYPDPVQNFLFVHTSFSPMDYGVSVYDQLGRKIILQLTGFSDGMMADASLLSPGIYTIELSNKNTGEKWKGKFIKAD